MIKALQQLSDIDRDIYDLLAAFAHMGIPFGRSGFDDAQKQLYLATLRRVLKQHGVEPADVLGARPTFTVSVDGE